MLPGIAGMRIFRLKCVETHEVTHIHIMNPEITKYSMKSATRIVLQDSANLGRGFTVRTCRAFRHGWTRNWAGM